MAVRPGCGGGRCQDPLSPGPCSPSPLVGPASRAGCGPPSRPTLSPRQAAAPCRGGLEPGSPFSRLQVGSMSTWAGGTRLPRTAGHPPVDGVGQTTVRPRMQAVARAPGPPAADAIWRGGCVASRLCPPGSTPPSLAGSTSRAAGIRWAPTGHARLPGRFAALAHLATTAHKRITTDSYDRISTHHG